MIPRTILVAPDTFKGTLCAPRVADAIGRGLRSNKGLEVDLCPVADGGEGTMRMLLEHHGGTIHEATVGDPLGDSVTARFALLHDGGTAVLDVAEASGLKLVAREQRDAFAASSAGTGELILSAVQSGASTIVVAAGGSASTDGGAGAIGAIQRGGGLGRAVLVVLCDVRSTFEQAAALYGPQKGADERDQVRLKRRLKRLATRLPRDPRGMPMGGAAGGLAGGLWAAFGAQLRAGAPYLLDAISFDERMRRARAVIVGEGRMDHSTLAGKAPFEIATRARQSGVPTYAVTGEDALDRLEARIMDLQVILQAADERALVRAGKRLALLV
ncbi:MAG: glycerate kinase family protein [Solirubrobacteraceae bacterium]